jgi:hypothetical protein
MFRSAETMPERGEKSSLLPREHVLRLLVCLHCVFDELGG